MALRDIGTVFDFPANIFASDNVTNRGALVAGVDLENGGKAGPDGRANTWYVIGFKPGATYDSLDANNGLAYVNQKTNSTPAPAYYASFPNIVARGTTFVRSTVPGLEGATVDAQGHVFVDDSKVASATANGKYGSQSTAGGGGVSMGTTTSGGLTVALPPGLGSASASVTAGAQAAYEFTKTPDLIWTARTPRESARVVEDNPHPGVSAINPLDVQALYGEVPVREALGLQSFSKAGFTGLGRMFVGVDEAGQAYIPGQEIGDCIKRAMAGDRGAQDALASVGILPPGGEYRQGLLSTAEEELARIFG